MPLRKAPRKIYKKNKKKLFFIFGLKALAYGSALAVFAIIFIFLYYAKDLPRPEVFTEKHTTQSTKIYDRTGEVLLYEIYGEEKRTLVSLDDIPDCLKEAVIATEDARFYKHYGVDILGIARSVLINLKLGKLSVGGSTIPQQLIRSTFFGPEKTIKRKVREIILALELNRRYTKDQILEWYLNQIPFGQNTYGVESASQYYFGKSVSKIDTAEAATLAALIQAPYRLSPYGNNKDLLLARKDHVLDRMIKLGYLDASEGEIIKEEVVDFKNPSGIKAAHFVLHIIENYLKPKYGQDLEYLKEVGLKIYTSLDWDMQVQAEEVIKEGVKVNKTYNAHNAALVAISPKSGDVLALVGSADWSAPPYPEGCIPGKTCLFDPQFNVAIGTKDSPGRQPGSAFKPFVYATAFKNGYTPDTMVLDEYSDFGLWGDKQYTPQNYDGLYRGWVSLRSSLSQSLNIPSIKALYLAGLEEEVDSLSINNFSGKENILLNGLKKSIETAKSMGITTLDKPLSAYGPSIVLGGGEVKLIDITSAYGVFANKGLSNTPNFILRVEDQDGNIIDQKQAKSPKRVLSEEVAGMINSILSDNEARAPMFGLNSRLYFPGYQVAAKTGTTDNYRDTWTIGYTPNIVVGIWAGNNYNQSMIKNQPAITVAGAMFNNFLKEILPTLPKEDF